MSTPLEMAQTGAGFVAKVAELQASDDPDVQIQMHINKTGKQAMDTAIVAGMMALVSIAESLAGLAAAVDEASS